MLDRRVNRGDEGEGCGRRRLARGGRCPCRYRWIPL